MVKHTKKKQQLQPKSDEMQTKISSFFENQPYKKGESKLFTKINSVAPRNTGRLALSKAGKHETVKKQAVINQTTKQSKTINPQKDRDVADVEVVCIDDENDDAPPVSVPVQAGCSKASGAQTKDKYKGSSTIKDSEPSDENDKQGISKNSNDNSDVTESKDGHEVNCEDTVNTTTASNKSCDSHAVNTDVSVDQSHATDTGNTEPKKILKSVTPSEAVSPSTTPEKQISQVHSPYKSCEQSPDIICETPTVDTSLHNTTGARRRIASNRSFLCPRNLLGVQPGLKPAHLRVNNRKAPKKLRGEVSINFNVRSESKAETSSSCERDGTCANSECESTKKNVGASNNSSSEGCENKRSEDSVITSNVTNDVQQGDIVEEDFKELQKSEAVSKEIHCVSIPETQMWDDGGDENQDENVADAEEIDHISNDEDDFKSLQYSQSNNKLKDSACMEKKKDAVQKKMTEGYGEKSVSLAKPADGSKFVTKKTSDITKLLMADHNHSVQNSVSSAGSLRRTMSDDRGLVQSRPFEWSKSKSKLLSALDETDLNAKETEENQWMGNRLLKHFAEDDIILSYVDKNVGKNADSDTTPVKIYEGSKLTVKRQAKPGSSPQSKRHPGTSFTELKDIADIDMEDFDRKDKAKKILCLESEELESDTGEPQKNVRKLTKQRAYQFGLKKKDQDANANKEQVTLSDDKNLSELLGQLISPATKAKSKTGNKAINMLDSHPGSFHTNSITAMQESTQIPTNKENTRLNMNQQALVSKKNEVIKQSDMEILEQLFGMDESDEENHVQDENMDVDGISGSACITDDLQAQNKVTSLSINSKEPTVATNVAKDNVEAECGKADEPILIADSEDITCTDDCNKNIPDFIVIDDNSDDLNCNNTSETCENLATSSITSVASNISFGKSSKNINTNSTSPSGVICSVINASKSNHDPLSKSEPLSKSSSNGGHETLGQNDEKFLLQSENDDKINNLQEEETSSSNTNSNTKENHKRCVTTSEEVKKVDMNSVDSRYDLPQFQSCNTASEISRMKEDRTLSPLCVSKETEEHQNVSKEPSLSCHNVQLDTTSLDNNDDKKMKTCDVIKSKCTTKDVLPKDLQRDTSKDICGTRKDAGNIELEPVDEQLPTITMKEMNGEELSASVFDDLMTSFNQAPDHDVVDGGCDGSSKTQEDFRFTDLWNRYTVQEVTHDRKKDEIHLSLWSERRDVCKCTLRGFWANTVVKKDDVVNIVADIQDNSCVIDDRNGLIIINPDKLLSGTLVVSSVFCARKSVLNEKFKGVDGGNLQMLYGSIIHSLFQSVLKDNIRQEQAVLREAESLLKSNKFLHEMYSQNVQEKNVMEEVKEYVPSLLSWLDKHTQTPGARGRAKRAESQLLVTEVHDIEENFWSPRFGLKGKIDMTVKAKLPKGGCEDEMKILPLELKTGKASFSAEHKGQVTLYSMMYSDRREDPGQGILLYLKHGQMETVAVRPESRSGLIQLRNQLAHYLSQQVCQETSTDGHVTYYLGQLPKPINNQRACSKCAHLLSCSIYQRSVEQTVHPEKHAMRSLVPETLQHLTEPDLSYFVHWNLCLDMESQESHRTGTSQIWCSSSSYREESGDCLRNLVISSSELGIPESQCFNEGKGCSLTFARHASCPGPALHTVGLATNDMVVISSEDGRYIALATGFVRSISASLVEVVVDRDYLHDTKAYSNTRFRLDRNNSFTTSGYLYTNLVRLMEPSPQGARLRNIIIKLKSPEFDLKLSKACIQKVKTLFKPLNKPQRTAILKVLMSKDYVLIRGFPGAGKTSTIVALVKILRLLGQSVLLTSYTHSAVDNILLKLKQDAVPFLRLGRQGRIHPSILPHSAEILTSSPRIDSVHKLKEFYDSYDIVATSCLGVNNAIFSQRKFDVCIVDEASQVLQPACLGPLFHSQKFVLVGDPKQLPPLVQSREAGSLGMDESLFARLEDAGATYDLNLQYRMNRVIMELSNKLVYEGRLQCGSQQVAEETIKIDTSFAQDSPVWMKQVLSPELEHSVVFVDTQMIKSPELSDGKGLTNAVEAGLVMSILKLLVLANVSTDSVGVISPYRSQVKLIQQKVGNCAEVAGVEVNTVDQYQGRDKSVIVVSFVRSQTDNTGELLKDVRRLNVALTRARHKLVLIGNAKALRAYKHLVKILEWLEERKNITQITA